MYNTETVLFRTALRSWTNQARRTIFKSSGEKAGSAVNLFPISPMWPRIRYFFQDKKTFYLLWQFFILFFIKKVPLSPDVPPDLLTSNHQQRYPDGFCREHSSQIAIHWDVWRISKPSSSVKPRTSEFFLLHHSTILGQYSETNSAVSIHHLSQVCSFTVNIYRYKAIGANATSSVILYTGKCISPCLESLQLLQ